MWGALEATSRCRRLRSGERRALGARARRQAEIDGQAVRARMVGGLIVRGHLADKEAP